MTTLNRLLPWLTHEHSLTEKLMDTAGDARLDVLHQHWREPTAWDLSALSSDTSWVMHRDILMWAYETPCWFARTLLPNATFQANKALFKRLKTEPLGHLIFNGTQIQRASLKHYTISPSSPEYRWLNHAMHQGASELWVRLSEFVVNGCESFILTEILLPGLMRYLP